jgi:Tubulin-tyrosine ligase family
MLKEDGVECSIQAIVEGPILAMIKDTLKAVETKINSQNRKYCYELFGYDFIIDQDLQPWLIEVNTNPCLEESSTLLRILLPRMIDDALKLTLDLVFPPKKSRPVEVKKPESPRLVAEAESEDQVLQFVLNSEPGLGCERNQVGGLSFQNHGILSMSHDVEATVV